MIKPRNDVMSQEQFVQACVRKLQSPNHYYLIGGYSGRPEHKSQDSYSVGLNLSLHPVTMEGVRLAKINSPVVHTYQMLEESRPENFTKEFLSDHVFSLASACMDNLGSSVPYEITNEGQGSVHFNPRATIFRPASPILDSEKGRGLFAALKHRLAGS